MGTQRVAATVWAERISPVFDVARRAVILTVGGGVVLERSEVELPAGPGEAKLASLSALGVGSLLCGAVSREVTGHAERLGLHLVPFLAGDAEAVIDAYLRGRLPSRAFSMPGRRLRRHARGGGQGTGPGFGWGEAEGRMVMPRGDGTGPQGQGPGTGRGLGPCGGEGETGRGPGRGRGVGGRGQGQDFRGGRRGGARTGGGRGKQS